VLSNFAEFAVYDCRARPNQDDKVAKGRLHYWTLDQFEEKWDEIAAIFSKEAVLKGSFDRFAAGNRNKRGTAEVDSEFLLEIEEWRDHLAKNIASRNHGLSQREINFAVQQTIDRIIFLRICEDRAIEPYGRLQELIGTEHTYDRLKEVFQHADERYNSGLFHFREEKGRKQHPDTLTPGMNVDDKALQDIFRRLYYPESPYEFSVLSADILGQVYEQFLGKVIRLTAGGHAKIEEKPEVKKAGGVYYTPTYIVDYIVHQTVGTLLQGRTPKTLKHLTVLDPACGSGSFLLGAYQHCLNWYLTYYLSTGVETHARGRDPKILQTEKQGWRLSRTERKRILLEHIFGWTSTRKRLK
jgi:type I restriction-modification system DNA methylase subunit